MYILHSTIAAVVLIDREPAGIIVCRENVEECRPTGASNAEAEAKQIYSHQSICTVDILLTLFETAVL